MVATTTERRKMSNNEELKDIMYRHRIAQWMLAEKLGVSENTVNRKLRSPMPDELYKTYLKAINEIIEKK